MLSLAHRREDMPGLIRAAWPYLAMLAAMLSFATGTAVAKTLFPAIGAEGTVTLRVVLSALLMAMIFRPWRAKRSRGIRTSTASHSRDRTRSATRSRAARPIRT